MKKSTSSSTRVFPAQDAIDETRPIPLGTTPAMLANSQISTHTPTGPAPTQAYALDIQYPPHLLAVLIRVSVVQQKADYWIQEMMAKLMKISITTTTSHLISNISYINQFLQARGLRTLHKTTWEGLHLEIITGHHPVVPVVYTPADGLLV